MKKLPIMALALFFICLLAMPVYSDVQYEDQEDQRIGQIHSEPDMDTGNSSETVLEGRKVTLEDGTEVVIVDVPDSLMKKTKVRFDKEGKAHVSCH